MQINKCKWCGSENLRFRKRENTPHYGEMICGHCGKHSHWISNPESGRKNSLRVNKKTVKEVCEFHKIETEICFFCLRNKKQLGKQETLTIDHIQEIKANNGQDQLWNMQVLCSACHKLKNWTRLYMNWHYLREENDTETT